MIDDRIPEPTAGGPVPACPYCGEAFFRVGRMHFAGVLWAVGGAMQIPNGRKGWWPEAKRENAP